MKTGIKGRCIRGEKRSVRGYAGCMVMNLSMSPVFASWLNSTLPRRLTVTTEQVETVLRYAQSAETALDTDERGTDRGRTAIVRAACVQLESSLPRGIAVWAAWRICYGSDPMPPRVAEDAPIDFGAFDPQVCRRTEGMELASARR